MFIVINYQHFFELLLHDAPSMPPEEGMYCQKMELAKFLTELAKGVIISWYTEISKSPFLFAGTLENAKKVILPLLRRGAEAAYLSCAINLCLSCGEVSLSHKQFGSHLSLTSMLVPVL